MENIGTIIVIVILAIIVFFAVKRRDFKVLKIERNDNV